jgi:hypothetical protein
LWPWYETAKREGGLAIADCTKCKSTNPKEARQAWACPYEPPAPKHIPVRTWDHPGRTADPSELDERGEQKLKVCPGYACNLPEVIETARARIHWSKGSLDAFTAGEPAHERLVECIEVLDASISALQSWELNKDRKH